MLDRWPNSIKNALPTRLADVKIGGALSYCSVLFSTNIHDLIQTVNQTDIGSYCEILNTANKKCDIVQVDFRFIVGVNNFVFS